MKPGYPAALPGLHCPRSSWIFLNFICFFVANGFTVDA
jgi:hypothetical protein